jgi:hypothetical protein
MPILEAWIEYVDLRNGTEDTLSKFADSMFLEIQARATEYHIPNWGRIQEQKRAGNFAYSEDNLSKGA